MGSKPIMSDPTERSPAERSPAELREAAVRAIIREVGVSGYIRFMQDISPGQGDYTKDRWKWLQRDKPMDELVREVQETERALGLGEAGKDNGEPIPPE